DVEERRQRVDLVRATECHPGLAADGHGRQRRDREAEQRDADGDVRPARPHEIDDQDRGGGQHAEDQWADEHPVLRRQCAAPSGSRTAGRGRSRTQPILATTTRSTRTRKPATTVVGMSIGAEGWTEASVAVTVLGNRFRSSPGWIPKMTV